MGNESLENHSPSLSLLELSSNLFKSNDVNFKSYSCEMGNGDGGEEGIGKGRWNSSYGSELLWEDLLSFNLNSLSDNLCVREGRKYSSRQRG